MLLNRRPHRHRTSYIFFIKFDIKPRLWSRQLELPMSPSSSKGSLDLIAESAADLQERLISGSLTSVELVKGCLEQIEKYDRKGLNLRSMIAIAPETKLIERAEILDAERLAGRSLSPLHGLPIIIKIQLNEAVKALLQT